MEVSSSITAALKGVRLTPYEKSLQKNFYAYLSLQHFPLLYSQKKKKVILEAEKLIFKYAFAYSSFLK